MRARLFAALADRVRLLPIRRRLPRRRTRGSYRPAASRLPRRARAAFTPANIAILPARGKNPNTSNPIFRN